MPRCCCRVYVQPRADFDPLDQGATSTSNRRYCRFPRATSIRNDGLYQLSHRGGTLANGRFGPDLTHLMSRDTIAAGAAKNTPENLRQWILNPDAIKPGSLIQQCSWAIRTGCAHRLLADASLMP